MWIGLSWGYVDSREGGSQRKICGTCFFDERSCALSGVLGWSELFVQYSRNRSRRKKFCRLMFFFGKRNGVLGSRKTLDGTDRINTCVEAYGP